ncbi:TonB-dependent receptor, partial [bacterium]|nr:TonB-dependent receptor [bacterium]
VPVRVELITNELMEMIASRTLADAVEFSSGIRVESDCQNCNFSQIRLLGLDGSYSQILMDGQPVVSSLAQVYGIEHIPARMIDQIEVVKGGGSAIYGPGSVGGVVNVISRDPVKSGGGFDVRWEDMNSESNYSFSGGLDVVSLSENIILYTYNQINKVEPIDLTNDGFTEISKREFDALGLKLINHFFSKDASLTLSYDMTREDRRGGDQLDRPEFMAEIAESIQSERQSGSLVWRHIVNKLFNYQVSCSFVHTERDSYYGANQDPNAYGSTDNPMTVIDAQFNHHIGEHILTYGSQFSSDELEDIQQAYNRITNETYRNWGLFFQDDWIVNSDWEIVLGLRVDDHSEVDGAIVSPRTAIKWSPSQSFTGRLSIATGFKAPQIFDEDLHITQVGGEGTIIRNAYDLKEESSVSYVLGGEWTPKSGKGYFLVECSAFYTAIDDLFNVEDDNDPGTPEMEFTRVNFGKAEVYGLEINLGYQIPGFLDLNLGFVEQRAEFDKPEPDFNSKNFFRTPKRYAVLNCSYDVESICKIFVGAKYTGEMKIPHYAGYIEEDRLETSKSFLTLDASISREFEFSESNNMLKITIGGKNLTDEYQEDIDQGADRDAGYVYGPRFPRSYYLSFSYSI